MNEQLGFGSIMSSMEKQDRKSLLFSISALIVAGIIFSSVPNGKPSREPKVHLANAKSYPTPQVECGQEKTPSEADGLVALLKNEANQKVNCIFSGCSSFF